MTRKQFTKALERREACPKALAWVRKTKGTPRQLWERCRNGEWMEWLVDYSQDYSPYDALYVSDWFCGFPAAAEIRATVPWELVEAFLAADYDGGESGGASGGGR